MIIKLHNKNHFIFVLEICVECQFKNIQITQSHYVKLTL